MLGSLRALLAGRVSAQSLAFVRIAFGCVLLGTALEFLRAGDGPAKLQRYFVDPGALLSYPGLEWVRPLPGPWLTAVFVLLALCSAALALGLCARASALAAFVLWTYVLALDATHYNNHYVLQSLVALLLATMPSGTVGSVGALLRRGAPTATDRSVPFWPILLLRVQLGFVYFFGGVAKLNEDYLVHAQPVKGLLRKVAAESSAPFASFLTGEAAARFFSYSGVLFDLTIPFLLAWRRTRAFGVLLLLAFHSLNEFLLFDDIGWFPLLGLFLSTVFFEPDWPARVRAWLARPTRAGLGPPAPRRPAARPAGLAVTTFVVAWIALGAAVPLRHFAIPGDVNWTEEGGLLSWRMKASSKVSVHFLVRVEDDTQPSGEELVLRDIDARTFDWSAGPELLIVFDPLLGNRIAFNRLAGGRQSLLPIDEATARIRTIWRERFEREPEFVEQRSFEQLLTDLEDLAGDSSAPTVRAGLDSARDALRRMRSASADAFMYKRELLRLQTSLKAIASDPASSARVIAALGGGPPFCVPRSPPADSALLFVRDRAAWPEGAGAAAASHAGFAGAWDEWNEAWMDLSLFHPAAFARLPGEVRLIARDGDSGWLWNPARELTLLQRASLGRNPVLCRAYAARVAKEWEAQHGRRPRVRLETLVMWNDRVPQAIVDPAADLAAVPASSRGAGDWILPPPTDRVIRPAPAPGPDHR